MEQAPFFKDELFAFWNALSPEEKNTYIHERIVFLDSHRDSVNSYLETPIQAVINAFCYQKRREISYNPSIIKEQYQVDLLEEGKWLS